MHDNYDDPLRKVSFGVWKKILNIVKDLKGKIIVLIIYALGLAALESLINVINVYAIETFVEAQNYETLVYFIIVNILMAFAFGLIVWGFIRQGTKIEALVNYNIREKAFDNLQRQSFAFFDVTSQGYIMSRMTSDSRRLANIISWALLDLVWAFFFMIFTIVILFIYSVKLALIVLSSVPIMIIIVLIFRKRILVNHRIAGIHNSKATAKFSEAFLGATTTKTLVIEERNLSEFENVTNDLKRSRIKAVTYSSIFTSILLITTYLTLGLVMYNGTLEVINNTIKLSTLFLFIRATTSFFDPVMTLTSFMSLLQQAQASAERVVELIEKEPKIIDSSEVVAKYGDQFNPKYENFETIKGHIEYKNISFSYNDNEMILNDFNFEIKAGQTIALVGHTGSGKTTLVNLLARFYEPTSGNILIDGIDYRERSITWLHSQIGYVLQSPYLFSQTIKENIKYGKLDASDDEIINAAKIVGAHDFIMKLDNGYNTHVGEGGNLLSLGQKQLISFARAIINEPKILILDEATSSIDTESEKVIQHATKELLKGRTSIIVAHRLSTIVASDIIIMLEMGKIIEVGSHLELLNKKGAYFQLYKNQFLQEESEKIIDNL